MDKNPGNPAVAAPAAEGTPLYQQVANDLIAAIRNGTYPVGSLLPTESDLCERFGVSRYTVREALRQLTRLGLVSRRQGSGTQVEADAPAPTYSQAMRSLSELFQYAQETVLTIDAVGRVSADDELAHVLGGRPSRAWLRLEGVRRGRDGRAICRTLVFVHPDYAGIEPKVRGHHGPIYQLIEGACGVTVTEVRQEIAAEAMGREVSSRLGLKPGALALKIVRRYMGLNDKLIEVSINHHPAEGFSYGMRLRREEIG